VSDRSSSGISAALALLAIAVVAGLGWLVFRPGGGERSEPLGSGCDPRLVFSPDPPQAGASLRVSYDHGETLKYVDLKITGPAYPGVHLQEIALQERSEFTWLVTALEAGKYRFDVWGGNPSTSVATCTKDVPAR
jgi:hypothetical protein